MSQALANLLVHIVFSTKQRQNYLTPDICLRLYPYINKILKNQGCYPYQIGGMPDHIHILCGLAKTVCISKLIEEIKTSTSKWIKTKDIDFSNFYWQSGYGAFSVSSSRLNVVQSYIANQTKHHEKSTFQQEFLGLLNKHRIVYDKRYLWD